MSFGYVTTTDGFYVESWILQNGAAGRYCAIATQYTQADSTWGILGSTRGRQFWFGLNAAGALYLDVWGKDGVERITWTDPAPVNIIDNAWHHVACRLGTDKRTFTVFVDGLPIASTASAVDLVWDAGVLVFAGQYQPKFGSYGWGVWPGRMAYIAAKDAYISDNKVWDHYSSGNGGAVYYGDNEVMRINRVLDWADTPEQARQLDLPMVQLQGIEVTGANALDKTQEAAEAATGYAFADGQTKIIYHNRRRRYNRYSVFTLAESLGTAIEAGVAFSIDDSWVYNDVRGDRPFGSNIRMLNQDSINAYGRKVYKITLPVTSHEELRNAVGWLLSKYKTDRLRVESVTIEASTSTSLHPAATGKIQIGDRITLDEQPSHAPQPTLEFTVEGLSVDIDFKEPHWKTTFNLSPAEYDRVFEIGVSALGAGDRIAY